MNIKVNGNAKEINNEMTLMGLIDSLKYDIRLIAVEYNYTIPSKNEYDSIALKDGDTIEIVTFMGGG